MITHMIATLGAAALALVLAAGAPVAAGDGDTPGTASQQVERGAKKVGEGIGETASGIGQTVAEGANVAASAVVGGAKTTGQIIGRAGLAVARGAVGAWETTRDRVIDFADDVVRFVSRPF